MADLMKPEDVARLLKVTSGAVRRWITTGQLAAIKTPGGQYRIDAKAVEALLRQTGGSPPDEPVAA